MENKEKNDLVLSYVVHPDGATPGSEKVEEAVKKGYRVIDVFTSPVTPAAGGVGEAKHGFCCVTVMLSIIAPMYYRAK